MCYSFGTAKKGSITYIKISYIIDLYNTEALKVPGPGKIILLNYLFSCYKKRKI